MHRLVTFLISKIRKQQYVVSAEVPVSYLLALLWERFWMVVRGKYYFPFSRKMIFVGERVRLSCKRKIKPGQSLTIGRHCTIDALSTGGIETGNNVSIGPHTTVICTGNIQFIGKGLFLGDNVGIGSHCLLGAAGGLRIEKNTIIGNFVSFHAENHQHQDLQIPIRLQGVTHQGIHIGANCWIGAKATILDGAEIGEGCIIAAGAVVSAGKYEPFTIYGGVPAKAIAKRQVS